MKAKRIVMLMLLSVIAVCSIGFLSACSGAGLDSPTNVTYDGSVIKWDGVEGAEKYTLSINGGTEYTVTSNLFGYVANGAQINVSIKAHGKKMGRNVESEAVNMTFMFLGKIEDSDISITDEGLISWNGIAGATAYEISTNASAPTTVIYTTEFQLPVGVSNFMVRPIAVGDSSKYSSWSKERRLTKLGLADEKKITYENEYIAFDAVSGAQYYELYIDGVAQPELLSTRRVLYNAQQKSFSVSIKAIGNHTNTFDSDVSAEKEFIFLDMVTGIKIEDGALVWNGDADKKYIVKINGREEQVRGARYSGKNLLEDRILEIQIKEIVTDATYFSSFSAPVSVYILPAPTLAWASELSLDGGENSLTWNTVPGASGYTINLVRPDGTEETANLSDVRSGYSYPYDAVGTYTITITANASEAEGIYYNSRESEPFTVIRPGTPEKSSSGFITSDAKNLANGFTVTVNGFNGCGGYKLYKNGLQDGALSSRPQFVRMNLLQSDVIDGQEDTYSIEIIGKINSNSCVTLNSIDKLDFNITILSMPQNAHMDGFKLLYDPSAYDENNYWVTGVNGGTGVMGLANGADLRSYLEVGSYDLQVCAMGNGSDVLPSNYSSIVKVNRLGAPYNIRIDTNTAENGILKYEVSDMASSIELYFDHGNGFNKEESVADVLENMNDKITSSGTNVALVAVANYLSSDGVYYITSERSTPKKFVKIPAPTNLTFDNTHLKWNQTGISEANVGAISYEIYNESNVLFTATQSDREIDISQLEGGRTYQFSIRAIGDGVTYINSEISTAEAVYKLDTPIVKRENNQFVWRAVSNASSYSVTVDSKLYSTSIHVSGDKYSFDPKSAFEQVKKYVLVFTAVGNGAIGNLKTIDSAPVIIEQETTQLARPEFTLSYDKEYYDEQGKINVKITRTVDYSTGYRFTYNGLTVEQLETDENLADFTSFSFNPNSTGEYQVYVNTLGGKFNDEGKYTLISPITQPQTMILLAKPDADNVIINLDGYLTFTTIRNADEYSIEFYINGSGTAYKVASTTAAYNLSRDIELGKVDGLTSYDDVLSLKVVIRAVGKIANKVSSQETVKEWSGNLHNK